MSTMTVETHFDPEIVRTAKACEVPPHWITIRYSHGDPTEEREQGPMRWAVDVIVIRKAARTYDQSTISGYGTTIGEAADEAIASVHAGYATGDYGPAAASKRKRKGA